MTYGQDISIPDAVCDGWHAYTDESGKKLCNYRFVKNNDGTFSALIKFADDPFDTQYRDSEDQI